MSSSFYPAARKVFSHPAVKWALGALAAGGLTVLTTGVWPFFKGWAVSRASTSEVETVSRRVEKIEIDRVVDFNRLDNALDDTSKLTEGERVQWTILRVKRLQMRLVAVTRVCVGLEARLRMPRPDSDAARKIAVSAMGKFDRLMLDGYDPDTARGKALEEVFGADADR